MMVMIMMMMMTMNIEMTVTGLFLNGPNDKKLQCNSRLYTYQCEECEKYFME